jgi:hypothetical protein
LGLTSGHKKKKEKEFCVMKITNSDIFGAAKPLEELSKEKFPIKVSYQVAMLIKELAAQEEVIEKLRISLLNQYGTKADGKITVDQTNPNFQKFFEEMNIIFAQEVEIKFEKIELPSEVDGKVFNIEPNKLLLLYKFITIK